MNVFQIFEMNAVQYGAWCYVMDCHNGFLDDPLVFSEERVNAYDYRLPDPQDVTWDYVIDIHEGEVSALWYSIL